MRECVRRGINVAMAAVTCTAMLGVIAARADEDAKASKADVEVTVAAVLYEGSKLWIPATIAVHKGDRVKVNLINNIPGKTTQHGWAIDAYKVVKVVNRGQPTAAEFVADKAGIFPIYCQLHPAHIGGQLIVLGD